MPGHDWNHNGKRDSFDRYIDYKLSSSDNLDDDSLGGASSHGHRPKQQGGMKTKDGDWVVVGKSLLALFILYMSLYLPISGDWSVGMLILSHWLGIGLSLLIYRSMFE